jgi:AraC-like DNA-binding protein
VATSTDASSQSSPRSACKNATDSTRHSDVPRVQEGRARGPLGRPLGTDTGRLLPSSELANIVEHYWWARWDVPEPTSAEVLTYPSVHVVFEGEEARILGVVRAKFTRHLAGRGEVFGIKFHPGLFRALYGKPIIELTDRSVPLADELRTPASLLIRELRALPTPLARAHAVEQRLRGALPAPDHDATLAKELVERVRTDANLRSVAALSEASGLAPRELQRLFRDYVGVGPKWVVCRFRLQEAAELLETTPETVAAVAASLGYFDQAHFVRDFKSVVGMTPSEYLARHHSLRASPMKSPQSAAIE